ncbi:MAG: methylenetetrahydrofolate--tRNA-(uracil(54)-C(5))-methyltransferase (FADH(2)-oxidizing) TrmFO [Bacillota bacterium]
MEKVLIVGAGLAGAEAAWQAACRGLAVELVEMRPRAMTPAHHTGLFAELVCSNSLRAAGLANAVGLLKEEMRRLGSLVIECADAHRVPAGGALAVDRDAFAGAVTARLHEHPRIQVTIREVTAVPEHRPAIIASGPLTSAALAEAIALLTGEEYLYFHDAAAPIVTAESIDFDTVFRASRYGKGGDDYLNCPMDEPQYRLFWSELIAAEKHAAHDFEREQFFEGCMPVEEMASRGPDTLLFGPLKPVGLIDPRTGRQPFAVVQLRQDNLAASLYNLVGFQTSLKWPEQKRVFRLIPGLARAEFARYGVMHRNTFLNGPRLLGPDFGLRSEPGLFFGGQITGVEGYVESAAAGLVAGLNAVAYARGGQPVIFPPETACGALARFISQSAAEYFQPMNINFGLFPPLSGKVARRERKEALSRRALESLEFFQKTIQQSLA